MIFPIENNLEWDSNVLNAASQKIFIYNTNLADTTLAGESLADLVEVIQSDIEENIVNRDQRSEIYARNIGLVIKTGITLSFCTVDCPDQKTIESGRYIHQTLTSYGVE